MSVKSRETSSLRDGSGGYRLDIGGSREYSQTSSKIEDDLDFEERNIFSIDRPAWEISTLNHSR